MISDDALVLDTFPSKGVAMIGAGYIAVEFAGIFRGFGAEVHLVYRGEQPLRGFDGDVRAAVVDNLKARGMHLHPGSHPVRYDERQGMQPHTCSGVTLISLSTVMMRVRVYMLHGTASSAGMASTRCFTRWTGTPWSTAWTSAPSSWPPAAHPGQPTWASRCHALVRV